MKVIIPNGVVIQAVRMDMVRALMNLFKNACESHAISPETFRTGSVWLTAEIPDMTHVRLIFRDNGIGLSADELHEVRQFIPGGTSKKSYGTGFGLPIAKRIIEAHGGALSIDSCEDVGTTVTVVLPIRAGVLVHDVSCLGRR
jgi:signal transduction histidine kinase